MEARNSILIAIVFIFQLKHITKCFIYRGEVATNENEYIVQILNAGRSCGGSLISGDYVLTAAHCFIHNKNYKLITLKAKNKISNFVIEVKNLTIHPEFRERDHYLNDIALIQMHINLLEYSYFRSLPLWSEGIPELGIMGKISGYGLTEDRTVPKELMTTQVQVIQPRYCKIQRRDRQFCAGDFEGAHDACDGDSGSTLIINNTAAGVLSIGTDCFDGSLKMKLSLYTSVTFYKNWIRAIVFNETQAADTNISESF